MKSLTSTDITSNNSHYNIRLCLEGNCCLAEILLSVTNHIERLILNLTVLVLRNINLIFTLNFIITN